MSEPDFFGSINFWDSGVWHLVVTFSILFAGMMLANIIRLRLRFIRRLMIPSAVLGGFLLLFLGWIWKLATGSPLLNRVTLEELTYHGLGLGFVALTLKSADGGTKKVSIGNSFHAGLTVVGTYLLQAILGLVITLGLSYVFTSGKTFSLGVITALGFGQGPGQAYNWGHTYETIYGFTYGASFGLTVAALGFISASLGGILFLNRMRRRGAFSGYTGEQYTETYELSDFTGSNEIPLSESMDKLTIQVSLVFIAYAAAYAFMWVINLLIEHDVLGNFGHNTVQPLLWGFNFIFGILAAMLLKAIIGSFRKKGVIRRDYTSSFLQTRISGFMFDVMVVASIAAIDLDAFRHKEFVIPLILVSAAALFATYRYCDLTCKRFYGGWSDQAFLALFGMLTGTASTGIILLRESDTKFSTPAADLLVSLQPFAIAFGFPMLLLLGVAPKSVGMSWLTLGLLLILFAVVNIMQFAIKRKKNGGPV